MSQLTTTEYTEILEKFNKHHDEYPIFIESGTHYGQTVNNLKHVFRSIHTVELAPHLYELCKNIFQNEGKVNLYNGDSSKVLPAIINELNEDSVFWLDGHWSGGETARGEKDCPLNEEIKMIVENFAQEALIIIDDYRLFGIKSNEDWAEISHQNLLQLAQSRLVKSEVIADRLVLLLEKNNDCRKTSRRFR